MSLNDEEHPQHGQQKKDARMASTAAAAAGLTGADTSVTLAGDPKQLGPVIHSRLARESGLSVSLLERLASSMPYATADITTSSGGSSSRSRCSSSSHGGLIVKLVRNYRSHPSLLKLPSAMFYGGELQARADPQITDSLLHWQELPNNK
jgi:putative helicase MOV10L1